MTREEAIKYFEQYIGNDCYTDKHQSACKMAVAALRAQQKLLEMLERRVGGNNNA